MRPWPGWRSRGVLLATGGTIVLAIIASLSGLIPPRADGDTSTLAAAEAKPNQQDAPDNRFETTLIPFLESWCQDCHGPDEQMAGIAVHEFENDHVLFTQRKTFERIFRMLKAEAMPPIDVEPRPSGKELRAVVEYLDDRLYQFDCNLVDDPGRPTVRRLNRSEYANTIRDLIGIDFDPSADFPSDDVGYGFDNIGDVLSLPPLLMEKYMDAAERIAEAAIVGTDLTEQKAVRVSSARLEMEGGVSNDGRVLALYSAGQVFARFEFPVNGEYILRAEA